MRVGGALGLVVILPAALVGRCLAGEAASLRSRTPAGESIEEAREELKKALQSTGRLDDDFDIDRWLYETRDHLSKTYSALPKNEYGRLASSAVRYMVQRHFSMVHGWLISGLELQFKRPKKIDVAATAPGLFPEILEELYESKRSGRGLSDVDLASMTYFLEHMVVHESTMLLDAAYEVNNCATDETLDDRSMKRVLTSFFAMMRRGQEHSGHDQMTQIDANREMDHLHADLKLGIVLSIDAVNSFAFHRRWTSNPFKPESYTFDDAKLLAGAIVRDNGSWQNDHCQEMKSSLILLDANASGSVPLSSFYAHSRSNLFTESRDYLQKTGSLDTASRVRVANYLLSPGLCVGASSFAASCCINECHALMAQLEGFTRAPTASPESIAEFVGANLESSTVVAPRQLSDVLVDQLSTIAARHNGKVPIYGRLFAQWMHVAFPYECPFPHVPEDDAFARVDHWARQDFSSPQTERERLGAEGGGEGAIAEPFLDNWELLPLDEGRLGQRKTFKDFLRVLVQFAIICAVARIFWKQGDKMRTLLNLPHTKTTELVY